jgi:hypothetical protein
MVHGDQLIVESGSYAKLTDEFDGKRFVRFSRYV